MSTWSFRRIALTFIALVLFVCGVAALAVFAQSADDAKAVFERLEREGKISDPFSQRQAATVRKNAVRATTQNEPAIVQFFGQEQQLQQIVGWEEVSKRSSIVGTREAITASTVVGSGYDPGDMPIVMGHFPSDFPNWGRFVLNLRSVEGYAGKLSWAARLYRPGEKGYYDGTVPLLHFTPKLGNGSGWTNEIQPFSQLDGIAELLLERTSEQNAGQYLLDLVAFDRGTGSLVQQLFIPFNFGVAFPTRLPNYVTTAEAIPYAGDPRFVDFLIRGQFDPNDTYIVEVSNPRWVGVVAYRVRPSVDGKALLIGGFRMEEGQRLHVFVHGVKSRMSLCAGQILYVPPYQPFQR